MKKQAFSLIEMMTALVILGIGIVAVFHGMGGSFDAQRRIDKRITATELLQMKLVEFSETNTLMDVREEKFASPYEEFTWKVNTKETATPNLFTLSVEISWQGRKERMRLQAQTMVPQR